MCFGVRFSLCLASWLSDFDHFFSVCVVWINLQFARMAINSHHIKQEYGEMYNYRVRVGVENLTNNITVTPLTTPPTPGV